MLENLVTAIEHSISSPTPKTVAPERLKSKEERDEIIKSKKKEITNIRYKQLIDKQKVEMLEPLLKDPGILVGKTVAHHVKEEESN